MPCYQIQVCNVELNNANLDLLEKALKKLGFQVFRRGQHLNFSKGLISGSYRNNNITIQHQRGTKVDTDEIKRAYSEQVVLKQAEQFASEGWEMVKDGDEYVFQRPQGFGFIQA